MRVKNFYLIQSIFYMIIGLLILVNIQTNILGAAIGANEIKTSIGILFGAFFLIGGIALLITSRRN